MALLGIYLRLAIIVYRLLEIWMSRNLREDCLARSSISPIFIGESMCVIYIGSVREYPVLGIYNGRLSGGMEGRYLWYWLYGFPGKYVVEFQVLY